MDERQGPTSKNTFTHEMLRKHFAETPLEELVVTTRTFAQRVRADLQLALTEMLHGSASVMHFSGVRRDYMRGLDFGSLTMDGTNAPVISPAEFEAVDVGEKESVRCLKTGLWVLDEDGERYAILMSPTDRLEEGMSAARFFVATKIGAKGEETVRRFFKRVEEAVAKSRSYRGKVLSLESATHYSGRSTGVKVHRLEGVKREELILPAGTVELLERNVIGFAKRRGELRERGQSVKKGLLFYGPPGTGKTHTIRYLAGALPGHTTFLITAEQMGLLSEYMTLARLLQPSVVVIEDADLIAKNREAMNSPNTEVMLNKLLNEMDGLREEAEIIFILTTNRPQALEAALASRPGRVDQAIEFPLPDEEGREKLVKLYGRGMETGREVVKMIVERTKGVSAAFIKELMRRSMQFRLERDAGDSRMIELADVEAALEEILFKGGSLNVKLLGGKQGDK